ncbi:SDR family oxidoreductase [Flavobacterium suaedae]|nr:SDR family oxidoreductase [Flavobacterium suaedae]
MKTLIIGAHGKIGQMVSEKMSQSNNFEPTAFIRKEEQKSVFEKINVPTVVESLENTTEEIAKSIKGFDAVVFTAGSGGETGHDKTLEIDLDGAVKAMNAAKQNNIKRFVIVSAALTDVPEKWEETGIKPYYVAKHYADNELKRSGLDYTIIRPVMLTDDEGTGKITANNTPEGLNKEIAREDVAETIIAALDNNSTIGKIIEISQGNTKIEEAVKNI